MKPIIGILIVMLIFCSILLTLFYFYPRDFDFIFDDYEATDRNINYGNYKKYEPKGEKIDYKKERETFDLIQILCDKLYAQNLTSIHRYGRSCFKGEEFAHDCVCYS